MTVPENRSISRPRRCRTPNDAIPRPAATGDGPTTLSPAGDLDLRQLRRGQDPPSRLPEMRPLPRPAGDRGHRERLSPAPGRSHLSSRSCCASPWMPWVEISRRSVRWREPCVRCARTAPRSSWSATGQRSRRSSPASVPPSGGPHRDRPRRGGGGHGRARDHPHPQEAPLLDPPRAELVKEGRAQALVTAGNTGAAMICAKMVIGTIPGVDRPAFAAVLPNAEGEDGLLDVGANVDIKPPSCASSPSWATSTPRR